MTKQNDGRKTRLNYSKARTTRANIKKRALEELWERGGHLDRILDDNQKEMYRIYHEYGRSNSSRFVFLCSRRMGKSVLAFALCDELCRQRPGARVLFLSKTTENLTEIIDQASSVFLTSCPESMKPEYKVKMAKYVYPNGSEIRFKGMDRAGPDSIRGVKAQLVVLDEFCFMDNLTKLVKSSIGPMVSAEKGRMLLISSSPETPGHESIDFINEANLNDSLIKRTIYDCPRWDAEHIEEFARDAGGKDSDTFRREYMCIHPQEEILSESGFIPIEDIEIGDKVRTHTGMYKRVIAKKEQECTKDMLSIVTSNNLGIRVTTDHKLLVSEGYRKDLSTHEVSWQSAGSIKVPNFNRTNRRVYSLYPAKLLEEPTWVDPELAYVAGWYTAEGHCSEDSQAVHFALSPSDDIDGIESAIKNIWGKDLKCYQDRGSVASYTVNSKAMKSAMKRFGQGSANKTAVEVINSPKAVKLAFLRGYFKGDGFYNLKRKTAGANSVSKKLIQELSDMCLQLGIACSIKKVRDAGRYLIEGREVQCKTLYGISFSGQGFVDFMREVHGIELPEVKRKTNFFANGYYYSLIRSIKVINRPLTVVDIEVEEDHSFCMALAAVHNCEIITDSNRAIFPACTEDKMKQIVKPYEKPDWYVPDHYISIDPGGRDQTAILFAYYDYPEATLVVEDEAILDSPSTEEITKAIKKKLDGDWKHIKPHRIIMDNNNLILVKDMQKLHGMSVKATKKDKKEAQVNNANIMLQNGQIIIDPKCKNLEQQCRYGIWNKTRTSYERTAALSHCDAVDALVYLVRNISKNRNPIPETSMDARTHINHGSMFSGDDNKNIFSKIFKRR